jgi:uncharacterized membrane protein
MLYGFGGSLLAAVAGYWVLERAETHKGSLRRIGRLLGAGIITVSILALVCQFWGACAVKKGGQCPLMPAPMSPAP